MKKTILVVDDAPDILKLYTTVLNGSYDVIQADGKESALALVKDREEKNLPLDLIVSDRTMDGENAGVELCKELQGRYSCILISSHYFCLENIEHDKKESGALAALNKPVSLGEFRRTIDTLLMRLKP
jgi:CheY-like chemotaxis protein